MNLDQLKYFLKLAETNHMAHAANELYISEAALSKSIIRLEDEIGTKLFDRTGRNILLNDMGKQFLPYAQSAVSSISNGISCLQETLSSRRIRLQSMSMVIFPGLSDAIFKDFPEVSVITSYDPDPILIENLISGKTDLSLTRSIISSPKIYRHVVSNEGLLLVTNRNHHLASHDTVSIDDFIEERIINTVTKASMHKTILNILSSAKQKSSPSFLLSNLNEILSFVSKGMGVGIMSSYLFHDLINREFISSIRDNICIIPIVYDDGSPIYIPTTLYWCGDYDSPAKKDLRDFIINFFKQNPSSDLESKLLDKFSF